MNRQRNNWPWQFVLPAAIAVAVIAGLMLGGPFLGFLAAAIVALVIVGVAIRMTPEARRTPGVVGRAHRQPAPLTRGNGDRRWMTAAAKRSLAPVAIAAAGIVVVAVSAGTVRIVGWGVIGVAAVVAVSLFFLEVGYSEDRALARERRARAGLRRRRHARRPVH
jgi:hypothetical protein